MTSIIISGWKKFKDISSVLCKKGMSLKIKDSLYQSYVRSTLSYGTEYWTMRVEDERNKNQQK